MRSWIPGLALANPQAGVEEVAEEDSPREAAEGARKAARHDVPTAWDKRPRPWERPKTCAF